MTQLLADDELNQAHLAESLLADNRFKGILKSLKNAAIREWVEGATVDARERAHADIHAIGRLEACIRALSDTLRLDADAERKEKKRGQLRDQVLKRGQ